MGRGVTAYDAWSRLALVARCAPDPAEAPQRVVPDRCAEVDRERDECQLQRAEQPLPTGRPRRGEALPFEDGRVQEPEPALSLERVDRAGPPPLELFGCLRRRGA